MSELTKVGRERLLVVVDPNVLVSAAIASGNPRRIVDHAASGSFRMLVCQHLLEELARVLARERFLRWRTRDQLSRFLTDIRAISLVAPDPDAVTATLRDPSDDYLIALARANEVSIICSGVTGACWMRS